MSAVPDAVLVQGDWTSASKLPKRLGVNDLFPTQHVCGAIALAGGAGFGGACVAMAQDKC